MNKRNLLLIIMTLFLVGGGYLFLADSDVVLGQDGTIPTRTPTPGSQPTSQPGPTATKDNNNPNPTDVPATNTPLPTNTSIPATATSSATSTITPTTDPLATATATPELFNEQGIDFPTAEACGDTPTIETLSTVTVYEGPSSDYAAVRNLGEQEVYPIIGRAEYATWWLIQLNRSGNAVWISDKAGFVHGYTGSVPIVDTPALNGQTATPGARWQPTVIPSCTVTPSATPSPTATMTPDSAAAPATTENSETDGNSTAVSEATAVTTNNTDNGSTTLTSGDANNIGSGIATAVPLEGEPSPGSANPASFLPIIGLVLIAAAVFIVLYLRRGGSGTTGE